MSTSFYNVYEQLTSCRVVSTTNVAGTYNNGITNNGVGATLTIAASSLTIDSVVVNINDRVLLVGQTNENENGIYFVLLIASTVVLQRAPDYQNIEQLFAGQYVTVAAGTDNAGAMYTLIEPLPAQFGVSDLNFNATITAGLGTAAAKGASDNTQSTVASVAGATVLHDLAIFNDTAGTVTDSNNVAVVKTYSTSSATPGTIRSLTASMTGTATTMTSGNLVGGRGVVTCVGASGGFIYGQQGKVISTGTLSGSVWCAAVFGQLDISAATINAGQCAPIWGDYGATSGTLTNQTGLYGIAMTNTTAAVLEGQLYLYGGATNLMYLNTNAGLSGTTYFTSGGSGALSGTIKKIAISVDGTTYYIPCATVVS